MALLADLKTTDDYWRLDELDPAAIEVRWWVRHARGAQVLVRYHGKTYFAQEVPARVRLDSPYRAPRSCGPWYVLVELTDEQLAEEEAWHEEGERWRALMHPERGQRQRPEAGRRWMRLSEENAHRARQLGRNRVLGRVEGLW